MQQQYKGASVKCFSRLIIFILRKICLDCGRTWRDEYAHPRETLFTRGIKASYKNDLVSKT